MEKTVLYQSKNTYSTLGLITSDTKNVWIVFHGMGYLSRFFIRYFKNLDPKENYIIALQAPSKYYQKNDFKYVGASWLTKENTAVDTDNVFNYVDAVFEAEQIPMDGNLILFGFSQGVSIAMRWMVNRKIQCHQLILYAGGIPNELEKEHLDFIDWNTTTIKVIYGDSDEYLRGSILEKEYKKLMLLFDNNIEIITFEGGHDVKSSVIEKLT